MNRKQRKHFEKLNKELLIRLLNKERGISVFDYVRKLVYEGKGLLTDDAVQKTKLVNEESYRMVRTERFLMGLRK